MDKAAGIVLYNKKKEILLQLRDSNPKFNPNKWSFFGGKFNDGETAKECILRECKEEINYELRNPRLIYEYYEKIQDAYLHLFIEEFDESQKKIIKLQEGADWKWFTIEQAKKLDYGTITNANIKMLSMIEKEIK